MKLFFISLAALLLSACATSNTQHVTQAQLTTVEPAVTTTTTTASTVQPLTTDEAVPSELTIGLQEAQAPPSSLAALDSREVECVAMAMYHEARGEGDVGMTAVGYTVKNRMENSTFPDSACGVVYQGVRYNKGKLVQNGCQFSWACRKTKQQLVPKDKASFAKCTDLAKLVLLGVAPNPIGKALYFHGAKDKLPSAKKLAYRKRVGNHLFYALSTAVASR